jgi:hypothetical protein
MLSPHCLAEMGVLSPHFDSDAHADVVKRKVAKVGLDREKAALFPVETRFFPLESLLS